MRRDGFSTLVLVALLVGLAAMVQIFQHVFTGQVTDTVARSTHGRMATGIGEAAVAEARDRLCTALNQSGSAAFDDVRSASGPGARALAFGAADVPAVKQRIHDAYQDAFDLESVEATYTARQNLTTATSLEYDGTLAITAKVHSRIDRSVDRAVTSEWSYRIVNLAPEPPLRKLPALVRTPDQLLSGRVDVPDNVKLFLDDDLPALNREIKDLLAGIDQQKQQHSEAASQYDQLRQIYSPLGEGAGGGKLGQDLTRSQTAMSGVAALPRTGEYMFVAARPDLAIGELRLQADFDALMTKYRDVKAQHDAMAPRMQDASDPGTHQRYADLVSQMGDLMRQMVERYARFRNAFTMVAKADAQYATLASAHDLINPLGGLPELATLPRFDRRVSVILDESLTTGATEDSLKKYLDSLSGGGAFAGMIFVQNPTRPLKLSGTYRGQWVLAVNGSLSIEGLTRGDPAKDSFTIIKVDQPNTTLALSGNIQATVVGTGQALSIAQGTQVTGGLFLEDVPAAANIAPLADGPEKLTAETAKADQDPKLTRRVTLSPWTRATRIARTL